jgi:hypothetical protein
VTDHEWCRRCQGPNVVWFAPSPLWNMVMRGNDINGEPLHDDLVCMACFVELASEVGVVGTWRLNVSPEPADLIKVTPSGRVWSDERQLWVSPSAPVVHVRRPVAGRDA